MGSVQVISQYFNHLHNNSVVKMQKMKKI
jgi:hypothetical protein